MVVKTTIRDIAKLAGVSVTTVSQILNHKGNRFSEETRTKVLRIVEEQQYKRDFFAANLINRHSKTVGLIVPDVTDFFFSRVIEGVESYLNPLGYMIVICNSHHDVQLEKQYLEDLVHRSMDGILFATPHVIEPDYLPDSPLFKNTPLILIDRGINPRSEGKLVVKEYEGAYEAMQALIAAGHTKIGMLKETADYYQLIERGTAYYNALTDAGLPLKDNYVVRGELSITGGYHAGKTLLEQADVTAIFCGNDEMAMGCYQAIYEAGKKVPDDYALIGFDGLKISQYMVPPLTTIWQPSTDIGFHAAKFLVDAIDFPNRKIPNKIFETKLIIRESTNVTRTDSTSEA